MVYSTEEEARERCGLNYSNPRIVGGRISKQAYDAVKPHYGIHKL